MKIIIAIDSFKGSLSATEAADAVARGIQRVAANTIIRKNPLGDGGEGTVDALAAAIPASQIFQANVHGPLGSPVDARFAVLGPDGRVAAIEMAAASGITLIRPSERNPLRTSTYGVGELIRAALSRPGVTELVVGLGGSATNDGGSGALQALGVEFTDRNGEKIGHPITGGDVQEIAGFDSPGGVFENLVSLTLACDVTNPLCGTLGASAVFGPQKGATSELVTRLDGDLARFASILDRLCKARGGRHGGPIADIPGAGAAGGLSAGLLAFFPGAVLRPGIDIVLDTVGFDGLLDDADLVITGEGKLDSQTLGGKAIDGVLRRAAARSVPAIAFAGAVEASSAAALAPRGLRAAYGLMEIASSVEDAMSHAGELLEELVAQRIGPFLKSA
ncbi:MAG: glycerate kinase [Capsulimonadaceae bacterium]|nr:glycerate kinase [Capsulimonadaceae bacterium]